MQKATAKPSGKLDNIKSIMDMQPVVTGLLSKAKANRERLETVLYSLKEFSKNVTREREEAVRKAEKSAQYAELIKQRELERRAAEDAIDQRTDAFKKKAEAKKEIKEKTQKPAENQPTEAPKFNSFKVTPPPTPQRQTRTWTPSQSTGAYGRGLGSRPAGGPPSTPRPFGARPIGGGQRPGNAMRQLVGNVRPTERLQVKEDTFSKRKGKGRFEGEKSSGMDRRSLIKRGILVEEDFFDEERAQTRRFRLKKNKDDENQTRTPKDATIKITTSELTVKTLSEKIGKSAAEIIKQLFVLGEMCKITDTISYEMAELVSGEFGIKIELHADKSFEEKMRDVHSAVEDEKDLRERPPVVTVLGHVDHGKTSLLDALRKTKVTASESGGITQHIGAYQVNVKAKKITFIDTPGHAAFDKMRERGAKITDIAILLVAGDDGVMPQTIEAIKHIQAADIPMIVAVNKMDKPEFNLDRVKQQLSEHNVVPEEWGGNAIIQPVSAMSGTNLDKLLEMILLVAEMGNFRANPNKEASGRIIESKLDKLRGPLVTILVQSGTLRVGDNLIAGTSYGRVKLMHDENGKSLRKATPATPIQVLGFDSVPRAGERVFVVDEKLTKQVASERKDIEKVKRTKKTTEADAESSFDVLAEGEKTNLNIIIKGDVAGSVEAIVQAIRDINSEEVSVHVIHSGVGAINDNDVRLAEMSDALLIAFHTKVNATAAQIAKAAKIKIHEFKVIYQIFDFVTEQMVRLFKPKFIEKFLGRAEVMQIFKSSKLGLITGCRVTDGVIERNTKIRLIRGKETIGDFNLDSLNIHKDQVKEVKKGFECGIKLENSVIPQVGDILECYGTQQLPIIFEGRKYEFN